MTTLISIIGIASLISMFVFALLGFVSLVKKNGKAKKNYIWCGISFIVFIIALCLTPINNNVKDNKPYHNKKVTEVNVELKLNQYKKNVPLKEETITLSGTTKNATNLSVNGNNVELNKDGTFSTNVKLEQGENKINFVATNLKDGKEKGKTTKEIDVIRNNPLAKLDIPSQDKIEQLYYTIKGVTEPNATVIVYKDGKNIATFNSDNNGNFSYKVNTQSEGDYKFTVEVNKDGYTKNSKNITVTRELSKEEEITQKRNSAQTIDYKHFSKNPDNYRGEYVKYTGKIIQIVEDGGITAIRLAVEKDSFGDWDIDSIVWVEYDGTTNFVEDDIVTVYGTVYGKYSYTSQAGWDITVPAVIADDIE